MIELTTTRHNPMIDPALHIWGWEIPVYLFLGGLVAGLMVLSGQHIIRAQTRKDLQDCHCVQAPLLSMALLSLGMLALFLDLEHQLHVWRLYLTFEIESPMSWGSWILILVYPALIAAALMGMPDAMPWLVRRFPAFERISQAMRSRTVWVRGVGFANMALGVLLGIYTGILLSALPARPLWNSAILGPLFLFSGLSTGAATIHMLSSLVRREENPVEFSDAVLTALVHWVTPERNPQKSAQALARVDNSFLTVELFLIVLYFIGMLSAGEAYQRAAALLLTGPYAAAFWVLVVGCGILVPLVLQFLQVQNRIRHTLAPALMVLAGGFALRVILVYAGQASHWTLLATR
jgi:formate-dependent nitrite reductase membrane component NrfD